MAEIVAFHALFPPSSVLESESNVWHNVLQLMVEESEEVEKFDELAEIFSLLQHHRVKLTHQLDGWHRHSPIAPHKNGKFVSQRRKAISLLRNVKLWKLYALSVRVKTPQTQTINIERREKIKAAEKNWKFINFAASMMNAMIDSASGSSSEQKKMNFQFKQRSSPASLCWWTWHESGKVRPTQPIFSLRELNFFFRKIYESAQHRSGERTELEKSIRPCLPMKLFRFFSSPRSSLLLLLSGWRQLPKFSANLFFSRAETEHTNRFSLLDSRVTQL